MLFVETIPAGHRDNLCTHTLLVKLGGGFDAQRNFAARSDQHDLRVVSGANNAGARGAGAAVGGDGDVLSAQHQHGWSVVLDCIGPGLDGLVPVGRTDDVQTGHGAQRCKLLDRLVCRAVFADTNRVVRKDEADFGASERSEADRRAHVVSKDEKCCRDRQNSAVRRQADRTGAHCVLADAEVQVTASFIARAEGRRLAKGNTVAALEVVRATHQARQIGEG